MLNNNEKLHDIPELEIYADVTRRDMGGSSSRVDAIKAMRDEYVEVATELRCKPDLVREWCDYHIFVARYS